MDELKKLTNELEESFGRWNYIKEYGWSDPFWEDGYNMNLVRNHIFYYKSQIKELCEKKKLELPNIYHKEAPPKTNNSYMARAGDIRINAKKALAVYKADKNYQYLLNNINILDNKQIKETSILNVIGYCKGLERYINADSLVDMRRHERYEHYLESFQNCRKKVEEVLNKHKEGQVSLFESLM